MARNPCVERELISVETEEEVVYWVYRTAWSGRFLADQMDEIGYEKFREEILKEFGPKEQAAEE